MATTTAIPKVKQAGPYRPHWGLHPQTLFWELLKHLPAIDLFLEVGSCDGQISFLAERRFPGIRVAAMEPHPRNAAKIRDAIKIQGSRVELLELAAGNYNGNANFYCTETLQGHNEGSSSLAVPLGVAKETVRSLAVSVEVKRLEDLPLLRESRHAALWIDAEGFDYQALEGAAGVLGNVDLMQVEAFLRPFREDQKMAADIIEFLTGHGYALVGATFNESLSSPVAGDMIFLRPGSLAPGVVNSCARKARLAMLAVRAVRAAIPASLHRLAKNSYYALVAK